MFAVYHPPFFFQVCRYVLYFFFFNFLRVHPILKRNQCLETINVSTFSLRECMQSVPKKKKEKNFCSMKLNFLIFRALTNMKLKLKGAQTGHSLLKRKSEALTKRFRGITVKIDEVFFYSRVTY